MLLEPDALAQHVRQLTDEVGLVCAIPYCARLENFAAQVEAAIINGPHARMLFLASALGQGHRHRQDHAVSTFGLPARRRL